MFGYVDDASAWGECGPLLYCLGFAIENVTGQPIDYHLRGMLGGDESAPSGGDPGWLLYRDQGEEGRAVYHAWTNPDVSGLDPCEGDYDESTVKFHMRQTLENFRNAHPERSAEVDDVIAKYGL